MRLNLPLVDLFSNILFYIATVTDSYGTVTGNGSQELAARKQEPGARRRDRKMNDETSPLTRRRHPPNDKRLELSNNNPILIVS